MKTVAVAAVVLLAAACASSSPDDAMTTTPATAASAPAPASDARVAEMQTQLTELLERIDVLNDRIARLEEAPVAAAAPAAVPEQAEVQPQAVATSTTGTSMSQAQRVQPQPVQAQPAQPQRAVLGAQLADNYRQAIMLVGGGKQAEARRAFEAVYDADPNGDLADNALFWIGETYYATKDYTNAVRYYNRVVTDYGSQNKAPDALFKIALAQERTGDLALARRTLQQVIERYPYSSPASSAKAELQRIKF